MGSFEASGMLPSALTLWPKRLVYTAYLVVATAVAFQFSLSPLQLVLVVVLPVILVDLVLTSLGQRAYEKFNKQLAASLETSTHGQLLALYRRQILLRFAAPRHQLFERLGLIHTHFGDLSSAAFAYSEATEESPARCYADNARKLANTLEQLGDHRQAERYYRQALAYEPDSAILHAEIGQLLARFDSRLSESRAHLERAIGGMRFDRVAVELRFVLVKVLANLNEIACAEEQFQLASKHLQVFSGELPDSYHAAEATLERARIAS